MVVHWPAVRPTLACVSLPFGQAADVIRSVFLQLAADLQVIYPVSNGAFTLQNTIILMLWLL